MRTSNERSAAPLSMPESESTSTERVASMPQALGLSQRLCPLHAQRSEGPNAAGRARCAGGAVGPRKILSLLDLVIPFLLLHRLERPAQTQTS